MDDFDLLDRDKMKDKIIKPTCNDIILKTKCNIWWVLPLKEDDWPFVRSLTMISRGMEQMYHGLNRPFRWVDDKSQLYSIFGKQLVDKFNWD